MSRYGVSRSHIKKAIFSHFPFVAFSFFFRSTSLCSVFSRSLRRPCAKRRIRNECEFYKSCFLECFRSKCRFVSPSSQHLYQFFLLRFAIPIRRYDIMTLHYITRNEGSVNKKKMLNTTQFYDQIFYRNNLRPCSTSIETWPRKPHTWRSVNEIKNQTKRRFQKKMIWIKAFSIWIDWEIWFPITLLSARYDKPFQSSVCQK